MKTFRDEIAMAALQGLVWLEPAPYENGKTPRCATKLGVAEAAYEYADAMLEVKGRTER